ncbi:ErfK/YbiS/YcfS/YnhG family protein [Acidithiobacillus ferrivorans]|uniref:ErfK/YbiS/YcfS/YnhG family protein n=1 Tax=Acidithiobacillus ferrivorans TaxID=160808 RepID=A0A060URQ3_9PROT|nr:L,D-transpeptidase family protein [Acidithiobacillus ferrivorans]CDQ11095.1 ErfK/YbiS/YcfS/YnhG family protein [Acidithiobacillus ferrivorans]SMH65818.1 ErfK/YbiS/YcfS/YnhG family protein [Acidithiobacillus ferrivorans]
MKYPIIPSLLAGFSMLLSSAASAAQFALPAAGSNMVGQLQVVIARHQDTLLDIARHYDVGYNEIRAANPGVDPWLPGAGTHVLVPTQYILPPKPWTGIIINIPERRLFYFPAGQNMVYTFPVGIFRPKWPDPIGSTRIIAKVKNPTWTVPKNIQEEHAKAGEPIPAFFPAGPDNPMGELALETGWSQIFIHGTNKPWGVGMRVSHGCFHVYPENEVQLFKMVKVGTPVTTIDQPYVVGTNGNGQLYLQSFVPIEAYNKGSNPQQRAVDAVSLFEKQVQQRWTINWQQVIDLVEKPNTIPTAININAPTLAAVVAQLPHQPYDFAPYGDDANTATPPPVPTPAASPAT